MEDRFQILKSPDTSPASYTLEQIEVAFFNWDNVTVAETNTEHWEKRRKEWALFKKVLMDPEYHVSSENKG